MTAATQADAPAALLSRADLDEVLLWFDTHTRTLRGMTTSRTDYLAIRLRKIAEATR